MRSPQHHDAPNVSQEAGNCHCSVCEPQGDGFKVPMRMICCQQCGNKRCPHATHHIFACTGSNEPGQLGSSYGVPYVAAPLAAPGDERDARDAARYRWLRAKNWHDDKLCVVRDPKQHVRPGAYCPFGSMLDEAIDAAMKESK